MIKRIFESVFYLGLDRFQRMVILCAGFLIALHVPLLSFGAMAVSLPMFFWFPEFAKTGEHVEIYFFGPLLKSSWAWFAFTIYFLCFSFIGTMDFYWKKRNAERPQVERSQ